MADGRRGFSASVRHDAARPCRPTGGSSSGGRRVCAVSWCAPASELDLPDRVLDLADDRVAEVLALARVEALERCDHPGHDQGDQEDQCDVLDGALPAGGEGSLSGAECSGERPGEWTVHRVPPGIVLDGDPMVAARACRNQTG